jgi:hypothetical protein
LNCNKIKAIFQELGSEELFKLCQYNKIESIAADALSCCVDVDLLPQYWNDAFEEIDLRIGSYMQELDKASKLLSDNNIEMIALKNSGITRGLYTHYGASPMGDIDVLVRKQDFRKAHKVLVDHGYVLKFRSPLEEEDIEKAEQGGGAEYAVKLPNGDNLWFELQWRPVAGRWIRPDQEPSADELMERSVSIKNSSVKLLAPEDNLLQVCLHTAKHSYVRAPGFRLHTDVDRIVRECDINWEVFTKRVISLEVKTATFFSLALASDLLDTPVPDYVIARLSPGKWKVNVISKWLQSVGLFDSDGKKWSRMGYIIFVSLLYDSFFGFVRGVIPDSTWMKQRYGFSSSLLLPFYHIYRLIDLVWKRTLNK